MAAPLRLIGILIVAAACLFSSNVAEAQSSLYFRITWRDLNRILDENRDGRVDSTEIEDAADVRAFMIWVLDKDGDEQLSQNELLGMPEVLVRADKTTDGVVDSTELEQWLLAWREELLKEETPVPGQTHPGLVAVFDANKDGHVTADEIEDAPQARADLMKQFDRDGNEMLSASELGGLFEALKQADRDGDGHIDSTELESWLMAWREELLSPPAPATSLHRFLDHNNNGTIEAAEIEDAPLVRSLLLAALDQDANEELSQAELGGLQGSFQGADADQDGLIDVTELEAWLMAWRERLLSES